MRRPQEELLIARCARCAASAKSWFDSARAHALHGAGMPLRCVVQAHMCEAPRVPAVAVPSVFALEVALYGLQCLVLRLLGWAS